MGRKHKRLGWRLWIVAAAMSAVGVVFLWVSFADTASLPGDLNHDGKVNIQDLSLLLINFGKTTATGDIDDDGKVNIRDLSMLLINFGKSGGTAQYPTPVMPMEPGGNVIWWNGNYYVPVKFASEPRIRMAKAPNLSGFGFIKDEAALQSQQVVWDGAGTPASAFINWPVAIYRLQNHWYMYMDASDSNPPNFSDRLYVLQSDTDDPMGHWTLKGRVGPDTWTLGFCPFEWNGQLYMVSSNKENHSDGTFHALAIASMSNPWTLSSDWNTLTNPDYDWEKWGANGPGAAPINEVDQPVMHNGKLHVIYSASDVHSPNYTAGDLYYNGSGDLLDHNNWTKKPTPLLSKTTTVSGAGQTFILKSPDGSKDYPGYAYWNTPTQISPRHLAITPITWDANNDPVVTTLTPGTYIDEPPTPK